MGEAILRALLAADPPDRPVTVASFGTGDWHIGECADPRTVAVLAAALSAFAGAQISPAEVTLDDVFMVLAGR